MIKSIEYTTILGNLLRATKSSERKGGLFVGSILVPHYSTLALTELGLGLLLALSGTSITPVGEVKYRGKIPYSSLWYCNL